MLTRAHGKSVPWLAVHGGTFANDLLAPSPWKDPQAIRGGCAKLKEFNYGYLSSLELVRTKDCGMPHSFPPNKLHRAVKMIF